MPTTYRITKEQERALVAQLPSQRARDRLFASCWPYVMRQAKRFRNSKLSTAELAQVGALGLLRAIEKFDTTKGTRLITYASPWIVQELSRYVSANQFAVRLDTSPALISAKSLVRRGVCSSPEHLASESGLTVEMATRVMQTMADGDLPLVTQMGECVDVSCAGADHDALETRSMVRAAVLALPDEQRIAVTRHHFDESPLSSVGRELGCSHQNIHQLTRRARATLRVALAHLDHGGVAH